MNPVEHAIRARLTKVQTAAQLVGPSVAALLAEADALVKGAALVEQALSARQDAVEAATSPLFARVEELRRAAATADGQRSAWRDEEAHLLKLLALFEEAPSDEVTS